MVSRDSTRALCVAFRSANTQLKRQSCWGHSNQCTVTKKCNKGMMEWCLQEAAVLLGKTATLLCHKNILLAQLRSWKTKELKRVSTPVPCKWTVFLPNTVLLVLYSQVIPIMLYINIILSPRESCLPAIFPLWGKITIKVDSVWFHPPKQPSALQSLLYNLEAFHIA